MYRLFDKHGTKFLAVVGSLLMLAFILPSNWGQRGNGVVRFGKLNGQQIGPDDVRASADAFQSLNNVIITGQGQQGQPTQITLAQAMPAFSPDTLHQLQSNPLQWYLLVREAEQAGVEPDEALLENALGGNAMLRTADGQMLPMKDINPAVRNGYRAALREAVAVSSYFFRSLRSVKISASAVDDHLAISTQQVRMVAASFKAADFELKIAPLNEESLVTQFKSYADNAPNSGTSANPFGFGYLIPDRVQLQWLTIPTSEVTRAVEAAKSPELWEEDAIVYYQKNLDSFKTSTTQPATRPFAEAKPDALKRMQAPLIEQKRRAIANRITQQMQSDMKPTGAAAAPTTQQALELKARYGVAYGSFDYLQKLSDDIQTQFGVKLTVVNQPNLMSREQLQGADALGMTFTEDYNTGADALFNALTALDSKGTLAVGQPAKPLLGASGTTIARVIAAEKAHAPTALNDVRLQVEKDLKEQRAFALAAEAAQKAADDAKSAGGLAKVSGINATTSDWFGQTSAKIDGVLDSKGIETDVIRAAFNALRGVTSPSALPKSAVARFERAGIAMAMEIIDAKTSLNTADEPRERLVAQRTLERQMLSPQVADEWFSMDAISHRLDYAPDAAMKRNEKSPAEPTNMPAPASPFAP